MDGPHCLHDSEGVTEMRFWLDMEFDGAGQDVELIRVLVECERAKQKL